MNIGFHCWEPSLHGNFKNSSGGGIITRFLFDKLIEQGNTIIWFGKNGQPPPAGTKTGAITDCDVMLFYWRWAMPTYPERQKAYRDQNILLTLTAQAGVPFIVHDQDYKMTPYAIERVKSLGGFIARPEIYPDDGIVSLCFPNPYELNGTIKHSYLYDLIYVGNNYERYQQTKDFVSKFSRISTRVAFFGNWLEPSTSRQSPEVLKQDFPDVQFMGRLPQNEVVETLSRGRTTIHLFKPEYGKTGFITPRWAEAAAAGTPAFIPSSFRMPEYYVKALGHYYVKNCLDVINTFFAMTEQSHDEMVGIQRKIVDDLASLYRWFYMFEDLKKGVLRP
jgi:hypothetical protein